MDALEGLQEAMLIAKPRDFFNFAIRYIQDDRPEHHHPSNTNNMNINNHYTSEELHYIQILPYLINNMKEFQAKACNIYCQEIISNSSGESFMKDYLEPSSVLDIIKRMKLESLVMKIKVIDEVSLMIIMMMMMMMIVTMMIMTMMNDDYCDSHGNHDNCYVIVMMMMTIIIIIIIII